MAAPEPATESRSVGVEDPGTGMQTGFLGIPAQLSQWVVIEVSLSYRNSGGALFLERVE